MEFTWRRVLGWLGFVAQLCTLIWYAASGLLAPGWAVVGLLLVWLALTALAWWLVRTRPLWTLAVPVLAAAIWFAAISAGEAFLGWQG